MEARRDRALDRGVTENGEYMTRRQWVERKVAEGKQPRITQEDKIKPMSRMQFFRATNEEQRAHDRRVRDAGKKDVYWIGNYEVTKIEHDYAVTLKENPRANESKPAAQGSESAPKPDTQAAARAEPEPVRSDRDAAPVEGGEQGPARGSAPVGEVGPFKYGEANREAKRLTAETGVRHDAVERERVDSEGFTVSEWFVEPAKATEPRGMTLEEAKAHVAQANIDRPLGGSWEEIARKQGGELNMKGLHTEPGKPPTPVTEPVIAETVRKAAGKTTLKPSEIKAKLLAAIDEAMPRARDADDADVKMYGIATADRMTEAERAEYGRLGKGKSRDDYMKRLTAGKAVLADKALANIGHLSFDIPGDGQFKVLNTRERLAEFRKQVETSPGFRDKPPRPFVPRPVHSTSLSDAIKGMIDDGDPQAAVDYAAAKGAKLGEVLAGDKKRLARVAGIEPTPPPEPGEMFSSGNPDIFYSPLTRAIEGLKQGKGTPGDWANILKGLTTRGVKADEIEWSGVNDWLKAQGKQVTREQVLGFLREGGVKVEEVQKGGGIAPDLVKALDDQGLRTPVDAAGWVESAGRFERVAQRAQRAGDLKDADRYFKLAERSNEMAERLETDSGKVHGAPKYSNYQLPGGENYREVLLTLPAKADNLSIVPHPEAPEMFALQRPDGSYVVSGPESITPGSIKQWHSRDFAQRYGKDAHDEARKTDYHSGHWDEPNVLAHIRLNDRVDADGKRVLFVEEIQSDWGQAGKRVGFRDEGKIREAKAKADALRGEWEAANRDLDAAKLEVQKHAKAALAKMGLDSYQQIIASGPKRAELTAQYKAFQQEPAYAKALAEKDRLDALAGDLAVRMGEYERGHGQHNTVPLAPFVTKTDAWVALALKRVIKLAVDEGYDRVAFINGEQSAERYDLSKQVDSIHWGSPHGKKYVAIKMPNGDSISFGVDEKGVVTDHRLRGNDEGQQFHGKPLDEVIGKELASKVMDRVGGDLSGIDLKVGGEGMRAFYDKIVPSVAKDVLRKVGGGAVEQVQFASRFDVVARDGGWVVVDTKTGKFYRGDGSSKPWSDTPKIYITKSVAEGAADSLDSAESGPTAQPGFDITPAMRESAAGGVPLFKGAPSTGAKPVGSPEALDTILRAKFGSKLIEGLHEQGILKYALARDEGQIGTRSGTKAVLRQRPGERPAATLYFDRLTPEQAPAALLHELGEHFGIVRVLGTERYNVMLNELRGLRDTPEVAEAWKHVERNYVGENTAAKLKSTDDPIFIREVAAKLVEDHPDLPFVRRLINEIRAFLYEHFGTTLGNRVDANLIRGMAASALRKAAKGELPATPPTKTFRPLVRTTRAAEPRTQP